MYSRSEVDKLTFSGRYGDFKPKTIEELTVKNHEEGESFILFLVVRQILLVNLICKFLSYRLLAK